MRLRPDVPVLARPDGSLQVGLASQIIFDDLNDTARAWVQKLERSGIPATHEDIQTYADVIATIPSALYEDSTPERRRLAHTKVRMRGINQVTKATARILADAGVGALSVGSARTLHESPMARDIYKEVADVHPGIRRLGEHEPAHVEIVTGPGAIDEVVAYKLMSHDRVHVPVTWDEAGVSVGPLVEPGHGPCTRCVGLAHVDADSAWPFLIAQVAARPVTTHIPADIATLTAAFVARMVLDFLLKSRAAAGIWRISRERTSAIEFREVKIHPRCGCATPL